MVAEVKNTQDETQFTDEVESSLPIIYTTKSCVKCNMTKAQMDKLGVKYKVVEASEEERKRFKEMGHMVFPVVVTEEDNWSDFRMDKIRSLAQKN